MIAYQLIIKCIVEERILHRCTKMDLENLVMNLCKNESLKSYLDHKEPIYRAFQNEVNAICLVFSRFVVL